MKILGSTVKRAVDIAVATTGLAATSPAMAAIAVAIRLDSPGPIIFRQVRLGRHGRRFEILKFRTMHANASVVISSEGKVMNSSDDLRHTRVGRLLRKLSLDELPQLVNVLTGEMSLVGPRPDLPEALELYTEMQRKKLGVTPGITGLAQVSGRNALSASEKWDLDARYAAESSLLLDAKILLRTLTKTLQSKDIY